MLTASWEYIQLNQRTLHLTLLVECSVLNFIGIEFRFMTRVKSNSFLFGEITLKNELNELEKVSVRRFETAENSLFQPNENLLVFWCCSEIFCRFRPRFCINRFSNLQNRKHEKRLETDVSSLRNPVIMGKIESRLTFGDRCSTNWAIPLNKKCCVVSLAHLQEIWYHRHAVLSSVFQHKNADSHF